jgi:hypothetical protein
VSRAMRRGARSEVGTDVLIVGGGLGGVAAAMAATTRGARVILTEETDWLGGQLTTQAAPPDEHPWIERFGATQTYRGLRSAIRASFLRQGWPTAAARRRPALNPGGGWVSPLCVEPRLSAAAIDEQLAPLIAGGRLDVLRGARAEAVATDRDRIAGVTFVTPDGRSLAIEATYVLDATDEGDLAPLAHVEHVTGFESSRETGEPSAPLEAAPGSHQAITHAFAVDHREREDATIDRPLEYDRWRALIPRGWPGPLLGWTFPDPRTGRPVSLPFSPNPDCAHDDEGAHFGDKPDDRDLWRYRRVVSRCSTEAPIASDVTIVNWPMNDYFEAPVTGVGDDERAARLAEARSLSLSLLYWLQTEAPRPDGGEGWPGLRLRGDVMGTDDGFAKRPYVREARRIRARTTVREQDISRRERGDRGAISYPDSIGVGSYRIDLHPSTGGDTYIDVESCPFEIPLGALVPVRVENLLAAAKNIGTTHLTSGCYRVHPVEWTVGEAAGALAAFCVERSLRPADVCENPSLVERFQADLQAGGVELRWPETIR